MAQNGKKVGELVKWINMGKICTIVKVDENIKKLAPL